MNTIEEAIQKLKRDISLPLVGNNTAIVTINDIETVLKALKDKEDELYEANNIISDYIDARREMRENIESLAKEMDKNGSMYWAGRLRNLL